MLKNEQRDEIISLIHSSLDVAEKKWDDGGSELVKSYGAESYQIFENVSKSAKIPSNIPGHPLVGDDTTIIDEFIACVVDMRKSSEHLLCAISEKNADVSELQRVFYETSALLPSIAKTIEYESGNVTEYLGDGVLALFKVDSEEKKKSIYAAHRAAKNICNDTREIINSILNDRYRLPPIDLGVGLALSKTIVTLVGLDGSKQAKAFGECVFRATKLSAGVNEIYIDNNLKVAWPKSDNGNIHFIQKRLRDHDGYLISKSK